MNQNHSIQASPASPFPQETAVPAITPTTDEALLDQALLETFPASDPISPGAGTREPPCPPTVRLPQHPKVD